MKFRLGLFDSPLALILTYPTFLVPFCTWLLMGYFRTVPKEVEECAMVDGATRIQALWRIVLPIVIPGLYDGRSKAFFFAHYEQIRFPNSFTRTRSMMNPASLDGTFTASFADLLGEEARIAGISGYTVRPRRAR